MVGDLFEAEQERLVIWRRPCKILVCRWILLSWEARISARSPCSRMDSLETCSNLRLTQIRSLTVFDVVMVKRGEKECEQGRLTPRFGTTVIFGQVIT
jgi:hypothetical protein